MAHKTKDGTWRATPRINGKKASENFPTRRLAEQYEARVKLGKYEPAAEPVKRDPTFEEFSATWLKDIATVDKDETTIVVDAATIRVHLIPVLGHIRLGKLRKTDGLRLRSVLKEKNGRHGRKLKPKSINNYLSLAKKMMKDAADHELIAASPFQGVKLLKVPKREFAYWTAEDRDRFMSAGREADPAFAELVLVATNTGLRKGELRALQRQQLDFRQRQIRVDATYSAQLGVRLERTKNGECAVVPMNDAVYHALLSRQDLPADAPVFPPELFVDACHRLKRRCKTFGLRVLRFHDLRHTYASILVMAGVPLYTTQKLMRHKSISMTERYAHLAPGYLREAAEKSNTMAVVIDFPARAAQSNGPDLAPVTRASGATRESGKDLLAAPPGIEPARTVAQ
ncbi:MAG: int [Devosia sp.]|uniref:tyrosine-type recombinase/integrase n=1 Tax=Devosia sp. TaxID=1871048 RepID=UPI002639E1F3|nr:site-specific integrase [Devosia sp.]MDB5541907.1 int [Devosia sp.]